jgi:hypothetical protein
MSILIGSEFRSWLLYYSIPILKDVLPAQYFDHYLLLVVSMYTLRGNCITEFELELSEACLNCFYVQFTDLYGKQPYICFNYKVDLIFFYLHRNNFYHNECSSINPLAILCESMGPIVDYIMLLF